MHRRAAVYILLLCSLVPIVAALRVDHRLIGDDPLITLTYAKNIAAGNGFVFNYGDPVLGTTTPLFALVIGGLMALLPGVPGTAIAVWTTAVCWIGLIWSFYFFRDAFGITVATAGWIGAAIAAAGWVPHLGMEAYPFALLLVVTLGTAYGRHPLLAGTLGGLLFLTRGEGFLFFGLAALAGWWLRARTERERSVSLLRSAPFLMAVGFLIPLGLWSLYAIPTFGNIFPNTLAAKIAQVDSGLWPTFQTRLIGDWVPGWKIGPSLGFALLNLFFVFVAAGLVRVARTYPRLLVLPVWALVYGSGYVLLGVPGYPWYRLPIEFVLIVLVASGLEGLASVCGSAHTRTWRRLVAHVPGAVMIGLLFGSTLDAIRTPLVREKDRAYFKMAAWFDENGSAGERIAYMEVGYLGYYTNLGIVDLVGLVTPEITHRVAARDFTSGFWELEPEYLVSLEGSRFILPILNNPDFAPQYERVAELDGFEGLGLSVFRRHPSRASPAPLTDPVHDDWPAERFEPPARRQLQRLGTWAETAAASKAPGPLPSIFTPDARSSSLTIEGNAFLHGSTRVLLDPKPVERRALKPRDALTPWVKTFRGDRAHVAFKIISFEATDTDRVTTTVRVEASARQGCGVRSYVAHWDVEWLTDTDESLPRINRIRRLQAESMAVDRTFFADRSAAVLGKLAEDPTLRWGAEYWNGRIDALGEPNLMGHQGIAVGDLSGDGLDDLYVAMGTGLPNKLLVRQPDGSVRDTADSVGVAWLDDTKGVLIIDMDNDGDKDLLTAIGNTIVLAKNDGTGGFERFVQMKAPTSAPFYSLSAADFDLDGDLDIYGVRYVEQSYGVSVPLPFHDANNGPSNHLMRNDGEDRFVDVTDAVGLDQNNRRFSLIGAWADYDRDGDPDLYVANDFGRNNLYRNDGGTFADVAAETGTEDQAAGMGVAWADYDADGDFDLYVTNMYSAAGKRVAYQPRFQQGLAPDERSAIQRYSLGNSLFVNEGGRFRNRSDNAGVRMGRWGWGSIFLDWDNDAQEDLLVPNGFVTGALEDDL